VFKDGDALYSSAERRMVLRNEACAALPPNLIEPLGLAGNAPTLPKSTTVDIERLPGFYKKWAGTAWAAVMQGLPDEDAADLGALGDAREVFRQLVREALLSEATLGGTFGPHNQTQVERRSVIGWCYIFAKEGPWRSIRSKEIWCKQVEHAGGEIELRVAIRHELLAQLRADRRLTSMTAEKFARRAKRYGVGRAGGEGDRPHGRRVIVLDREFLADLLSSVSDEPQGEGVDR
jgi:hypothetical protein